MPDYNLGRAHGKITVDTEVNDVLKTNKAFSDLERQANKLTRQFKELEKSMTETERAHLRQKIVVSSSVKEHNHLVRSLGAQQVAHRSLAKTILSTTNTIYNSRTAIRDYARQALAVAKILEQIGGKKQRFDIAEMIIGKERLANVNASLGRVSKGIVKLGTDLATVSAAAKVLRTGLTAFTRTGLFLGLSSQVIALGRNISKTKGFAFLTAGLASLGRMAGNIFPGLHGQLIRLSNLFKRNSGDVSTFVKNLEPAVSALAKIVIGTGVVASAFSQLYRYILWVGGAFLGLGIGATAIKLVGNIVMGLVDAVKQLAGGLAVLPGLYATIGTVVGTVAVSFIGLKDAMKAAFEEDPEKFLDAIQKLPPVMQSIAFAVRDVKPALKDLRDSVQNELLKGAGDDIKILVNQFLPTLKTGMVDVAGSLRALKDRFVSFLTSGVNLNMMNTSFILTTRILSNLSKAVQPFLHALGQIILVGQEAMVSLTKNTGTLAERFDRFISSAAQTGKIRRWIEDAVTGVKDLSRSIYSTWQVLVTFFRAFGGEGEDALARFASYMDKAAQAIKKSEERGGGLRQFADAMKRISPKGLELIHSLFVRLKDVLIVVAPTVEKIFNAFTKGFTFWSSNFIKGWGAIEGFVTVIKGMHIEGVIGQLVAFMTVTKAISFLAKPIKAFSAALAGIGLAAQGTISGFKPMLLQLELANRKVGLLPKLWNGAKVAVKGFGTSLLSFVGGALGLAVIAIAGLAATVIDYVTSVRRGQEALNDMNKSIRDSAGTLVDAWREAGGVLSKPIFDTATQEVQKFRQALDTQIASIPDFFTDRWSKFINSTKRIFGHFDLSELFHSELEPQVQQIKNVGEAAKRLDAALDQLGVTDRELAELINGSNDDWNRFVERLVATGKASKEDVGELQKLRDIAIAVRRAAEDVGPAAVRLSDGLVKIQESAGDASQKLTGLKEVLQALGYLPSDATTATEELTKSYWDLSESQDSIIDKEKPFGDQLLENNKLLTDRYANAAAVREQLQKLSEEEQKAVSEGMAPEEARKITLQKVEVIASAAGISPDRLINYYQTQINSAPPLTIKAVLAVADKTTLFTQLTQIQQQWEAQVDKSKPLKLFKIDKNVAEFLKNQGFDISQYNPTTGELILPPLSDEQKKKLQDSIAAAAQLKAGEGLDINLRPTVAPGAVNQAIQDNVGNKPVDVKINPLFPGQEPPEKPAPEMPPGTPPIPPVYPGYRGGTAGPFGGNIVAPESFGNLPAEGQGQAAIASAQQAAATVTQIFQDLSNGIIKAVQGLAQQMFYAGMATMRAFANGITAGTSWVVQAVRKVIQQVSDHFPRSPAKTGPFSGTGSPEDRGEATAQDYAQGLASGTAAATNAAKAVAGGAAGGLTPTGGLLGALFGDLKQWYDFSRRIFDLFKNLEDIAEQFGKFADEVTKITTGKSLDELLSGGKKRYAKTVSDEELLRKRQDDRQNAILDAADRNNANFDDAIKDIPGQIKTNAPGSKNNPLTVESSEKDKKEAIVARGKALGLSDAEIKAILGVAKLESDYKNLGFMGFPAEYAGDPQKALDKFFENYMGRKPAGGLKTQEELINYLWHRVQAATDPLYAKKLEAAIDTQTKDYQSLVDAVIAPTEVGGVRRGAGRGGGPIKVTIPPKVLREQNGLVTQRAGQVAAALISAIYPEIVDIGGARGYGTAANTHDVGRAIDIFIPGYETAAGKALGNQINDFLRANAEILGIDYTIWQDTWKDFSGNVRTVTGHMDHIDVQFKNNFIPNLDKFNATLKTVPSANAVEGSNEIQDRFNKNVVEAIVNAGKQRGLTVDEISAGVGAALAGQQPGMTPEQLAALAVTFWDKLATVPAGDIAERSRIAWENRRPPDWTKNLLDGQAITNDYLATGNVHLANTDNNTLGLGLSNKELVDAYLQEHQDLQAQLDILENPKKSPEEQITSLGSIDEHLASIDQNTPQGRAITRELESRKQAGMTEAGITEEQGAGVVDQISQIAQGAVGIAEDIFGLIDATLNSITAANNLGSILVRGIANTKDVMNIVDQIQTFIDFAAKVAQTVADVSSAVGGIAGVAGPAGGQASSVMGAVSTMAGIISSAISAVNATIDLIQEGITIAGKYIGRALTSWLGFGGVAGNVKFLLDLQEGVLKAYTEQNPLEKTILNTFSKEFGFKEYPGRTNQVNNQLNIYAGPGTDPQELMSEAMWQVRTAGVGVFGYGD